MGNYVDNEKLYQHLIEYKKRVKQSKTDEKPKPQIPNYVGECLMLIAQRLSLKPNFINYTYRDEMISDGIENCVMYLDNFNTEKYNNPFAYFTQIIYFAFIRRIQREKKQTYIKQKVMENMVFTDEISGTSVNLDNEKMQDVVETFEAKKDKKKDGKGKPGRRGFKKKAKES